MLWLNVAYRVWKYPVCEQLTQQPENLKLIFISFTFSP